MSRLRIARRQIAILVLTFLSTDQAAHACPVCYGDPDSDVIYGAKLAVLVLGGVVYLMLIAFAGIGIRWVRRARQLENLPPSSA